MKWFKLIKIGQVLPIVGPVPLPPVNKLPPGVEVGILPLPPVELVGVPPAEIHFGPALFH